MYAYIYIYIYIQTHIYIYIDSDRSLETIKGASCRCVYLHSFLKMRVCLCSVCEHNVGMYICMYLCMHVCMHIYIYICSVCEQKYEALAHV
jgi:hypothetical protein